MGLGSPPPAVAALRVAVRRCLQPLADDLGGGRVLVACSGGADSLALAAATAFAAPRLGIETGAVVVDHGLQEGSAQVAERAAQACTELGLDPVRIERVQVVPSAEGPEADARRARYDALAAAAGELGAVVVLLGHTLDDQAEQVLLGLARGSGARSLSGMRPYRALGGGVGRASGALGGGVGRASGALGGGVGRTSGALGGRGETGPGAETGPGVEAVVLVRPLLGVRRATTAQACAELGLVPWQDPHNEDPRYARVRARRALADLERDLGPGLAESLARTADQLRDDVEVLEAAVDAARADLREGPWEVGRLLELPRAVRTRLWREAALAAGSPGTDLTSGHLLAVDALLTDWHGQGPLHLPGGVRARREGGRLHLHGARHTEDHPLNH